VRAALAGPVAVAGQVQLAGGGPDLFPAWNCPLVPAAVKALRPLPGWPSASPDNGRAQLGLAAIGSRPGSEPGMGAVAGRGTPSPSVVSELSRNTR
jgi:hypothetical protein